MTHRSGLAGSLISLVLAGIAGLAHRPHAVELPPGFTAETLVTNINAATALTITPDGRVIYAEQTGRDGNKFVQNSGSLIRIRYTGESGEPAPSPFPRRLDETHLFLSLSPLQLRDGYTRCELNAPPLPAKLNVERWLSLPPRASIQFSPQGEWGFPSGAIVVQHYRLHDGRRDGAPFETRVLWFTGPRSARAAAYRWDHTGQEASLIEEGAIEPLPGQQNLYWYSPGPENKLELDAVITGFQCHLNTRQLNRDVNDPQTGIFFFLPGAGAGGQTHGVPTDKPASFPESLAGLIERVTFFNEENGFAVLKVKVKGHRDLVTMVGSLPSVTPGEWVNAEGRWTRDKDFGQQFRAELLSSTPPTSREGIEKYLGSGMVKGIGPVYAKKLVAQFGEEIFDIIENQSKRLEEVDGIGPNRRRQIKDAWGEQKTIRQIMVFLHSHGVSTSRAVRIYKNYGESAIQTVQQNPYVLAKDIHGIGFKTADDIARRMGVPADSLQRAAAGLSHVLLEATGQGHCALPRETLLEETIELLQVNETIVVQALQRNLVMGELVADTVQDRPLVYLARLRDAEIAVAARVRALARAPSLYPPIDQEKAISWCEAKTGKQLAASQRAALAQALSSRLLILTGGPGVGKTTLVNAILLILRAKKVRCLLAAPTGRAARRLGESTGMEARTIHRLLEVQAGRGGFVRRENNPLECDLLVVDEVSMVDLPLFHALLRALPPTASLLLVGDADQLPSVGPGSVLIDLIRSGIVPVVRLTEVFRQAAASRIITAAHAINQGRLPDLFGKADESDFYFIERAEPGQIAQSLREVVGVRIPKRFQLDPIRDIQVLSPMNRGSLGIRELNIQLQDTLNPLRPDSVTIEKFGSQFRTGDKVIQTTNNYDKDVFNGDIGQIKRIDTQEREVTIQFEERLVSYDYGELDEIALAYAITIHKSQGSEFPAVVIPLATQHYMLLQRNLIYTGVTRGRQLVVLIGQPKALGIAVRNQKTDDRCSGLLPRLRAADPPRQTFG